MGQDPVPGEVADEVKKLVAQSREVLERIEALLKKPEADAPNDDPEPPAAD